jgi:hypothetical protein
MMEKKAMTSAMDKIDLRSAVHVLILGSNTGHVNNGIAECR